MSKSWGRDFDTISVDTRAEGSHFGLHSTSVYHIDQSILFHGISLGLCIPHIGLEKLLSLVVEYFIM